MNNAVLLSGAAMAAGALAAAQAPTNALLTKGFGSPFAAALVSFLIGSAVLALVVGSLGFKLDSEAVRNLPWHAWLGGLYGAFFVTIAALAAPRLGAGALLTAIIAGQVLMALMLDHYGFLGLPRQSVSLPRLLGALMVIGGVLLVRRS